MVDNRIKIIVEANIPYFKGLLDDVAEISYLPAADITVEALRGADALVTRTRTRCDKDLLDGTRCSIVASATIGLDHVDIPWCEAHGIEVCNAPGCNAPAVAQYVFASLLSLRDDLRGATLGVVGAGHVGSIVADWGRQLGMTVLLNDPPRAAAEGAEGFVTLDTIAAEADFVTFHTPFTKEGDFPTYHLCDAAFISSLRRKPVIINSARGPVTDTGALLSGLSSGKIGALVIDCWEGEPEIDRHLLDAASIATPHIAGYSRQGKMRASLMAAQAIARHFSLSMPQGASMKYLPDSVCPGEIKGSYNPLADTAALRSMPHKFEQLRNTYPLRNEVGFAGQ